MQVIVENRDFESLDRENTHEHGNAIVQPILTVTGVNETCLAMTSRTRTGQTYQVDFRRSRRTNKVTLRAATARETTFEDRPFTRFLLSRRLLTSCSFAGRLGMPTNVL